VIRTELLIAAAVIPHSHALHTLPGITITHLPCALHSQKMSELYEECESHSPSMDRIRQLVNDNPDAVKLRTDYATGREIPLHAACRAFEDGGGSLEVVQYLIQQWPESVKTVDKAGYLPLHYACRNKSPLEILQYLVEQWPESVRAVNNKGYLTLHFACANKALAAVQYLVEQWPVSVKAVDKSGYLPLHSACANMAPLELVQYLVEQRPESVKTATYNSGAIPLHYACSREATLEVVQYLIEQWPVSVKAVDKGGYLPLHDACRNKAPLAVVQYLVGQWPESVTHRNSLGETPLNCAACQYLADSVVINWLKLPWSDRFN
jgi:ankyrin repeat protein